MRDKRAGLGFVLAGMMISGEAVAQEQRVLVESPIPFSYSRGRNVSVAERELPELQALGMNLGGFTFFPRVQVSADYTDNVYQSKTLKVDDAVFTYEPGVAFRSNWSRHSLNVTSSAVIRRYAEETSREEDGWNIASSARLDIGGQSSINLEAGTATRYESQFSGAALPGLATPREYQRYFGLVRGSYVTGVIRIVGTADYNNYDFKSVRTLAGAVLSQDTRDREVTRATGQVEYAISPDTSLFVQAGYTDTSYDQPIGPLTPNRDSDTIRLLAGASFDLTAFLRGSVGVGYLDRDFTAPIYKDVKGLSFEAQIEYFPTSLTTISATLRRIVEDSTQTGSSGYYNTGGSLRIDHELLRTLLLTALIDYEVDDYRGIASEAKIFRGSVGARYILNRNVAVNFELSYGDRDSSGIAVGPEFSEKRGRLSFLFQL